MAVYIALQDPTVTLKIKSAKDCAGKTAQMFAEFKRYPSDEADEKLRALEALINDKSGNILLEDSAEVIADKKVIQRNTTAAIRNFIKDEIVSLQKVPLMLKNDETGKVTSIEVPDTKAAKDNEELWGEASNCLDFLLDMILASTPWSSSLISSIYSVLTNMNLGADAEVKNF
jgi:hypothetical protein